MTSLADIIPFGRISPGYLLLGLDAAHPELIAWSHSNEIDTIAPRRLAQLVLEALPDAFDVTLEELIADQWHSCARRAGPPTLINRPQIEILVGGVVRWVVPLELTIDAGRIVGPCRCGSTTADTADPAAGPADILLSIRGAAGRPPARLLAETRTLCIPCTVARPTVPSIPAIGRTR